MFKLFPFRRVQQAFSPQYESVLTSSVSSLKTLILSPLDQQDVIRAIESLCVVNSGSSDLRVTVFFQKLITPVTEQSVRVQTGWLCRFFPLKAYETRELMSLNSLYLQPNDTLFAYSDAVHHVFDCLVSYKKIK